MTSLKRGVAEMFGWAPWAAGGLLQAGRLQEL